MTEAVFNRIVAIVENGSYESASLTNTKALRSFSDTLSIGKRHVLILPRGDSGWVKASGASWYNTNFSYDLSFYIQEAKTGNDVIGIADASNYNLLATKIFLSRPQLQLSGASDLADIAGEISWQTTSNLALPIPYPPANVSSNQGAIFYWGFIVRLIVPYRIYITMSPQG